MSYRCLPHIVHKNHWTPCVLPVSTTHSQSTNPLNTLCPVSVYHTLTVHKSIEHPLSCMCLPHSQSTEPLNTLGLVGVYHTHSPQIHWTPPSWRFLQSANTKTTSILWWPGLLKKLVYSVSWPGCSHTHKASTCNTKNQFHYSETHLLNQ